MNASVVISLWLALLVSSSPTTSGQKSTVDLKTLCANKHIDLRRSSHIRSLVEQLDSAELAASCSPRVRVALIELDQLITSATQGGDLCTLAVVEKIKEYNEKYIGTTAAAAAATTMTKENELPNELKDFILGYGLKVSNLCKKNMINSLVYESHQLLQPEDFEAINPFTDDASPIGQIMNEPSDYDDLLLPRDLNRVLTDDTTGGSEDSSSETPDSDKIFLQTATGHLINRLQTLCERRFKPLYEHLIMPLIYLSNLGFNYQGEDLEREMKEMSVNKDIHQWYRIVYLCESMTGIEIVEDPDDTIKTEGTDKRLVRILSSEEAAKIKGQAADQQPKDNQFEDIKQVVYAPEFDNLLEDEVIDPSDKSFMKLINSFATHKSELDRIRGKLLRKLATFLFDKLKRGQFKMIHSLMTGSKPKPGEASDDNDLMVRVFDEYVSEMNSGSESAVAGHNKRLKLTSNLGGVAKRYYHSAATEGLSGMTGKMARKTIDKARISRYFYYSVAVALFISGIVFLIG